MNLAGLFIAFIIQLFGFWAQAQGQAQVQESSGYLAAMSRYQELLRLQMEFVNQSQDEKLVAVTKKYIQEVDRRIEEMKSDYRAQFIFMTATPEIKSRLRKSETDVKWSVEIILNLMAKYLNQGKGPSKSFISEIEKNTESLEQYKTINPKPLDELYQRLPSKFGRLKALCSIAAGICRQNGIDEMLRGMSFDSINKAHLEMDLSGIKPLAIPDNASVVLILNHENTIADQKLMQIIAEKLGLHNNLLTTTVRAWPDTNFVLKPATSFNRESNAVFIEDPQFNQKVMGRLKDNSKGIPSVAYFPEGDQTFWSAGFPVIAKSGGFLAARKAAVELSSEGRPVYVVEIHMNYREVMTTDSTQLRIEVSEPERVPTEKLSKSDAWLETKRLVFEARVNSERGIRIIDLKKPRKNSDGLWVTRISNSGVCRQSVSQ
jgi:hypothetical protein